MKQVAAILGTAFSLITISCGGVAPDGKEGTGDVDSVGASLERASEVGVAPSSRAESSSATAAPSVSFVATHNCQGLAGTWRGESYSEPHGSYYEFTVHIVQPDRTKPQLSGSIVARSWQAGVEDIVPPDTCDGQSFHWSVVEEALGELSNDGSLHFAATTWRVGEQLCGETAMDYSLDRLETAAHGADERSDLTTLRGVISDDGLWAEGVGVELTRVACE